MKTNIIYSASKIFGLYPFDGHGLSKVWLHVSVGLHLGTAAAYAMNVISIYPKNQGVKLSTYIDFALLALQFATTSFHFFRATLNRKVFDATKSTAEIESPYWVNFAAAAQLVWKMTVLLTVVATSNMQEWMWKIAPNAQSALTYLIALQYISSLSIKSQETNKLKRRIVKYPEAACIHLFKISDQVEEIHQAYAPQLLFVLAKLLLSAVYFAFKAMRADGLPVVHVWNAAENLIWVLFIQWACSNFDQQVSDFYAELIQVIWAREDLCSNRKMCLYATVQRRVDFSTCGFFTLGYPLFQSSATAATTYLVILLQFEY